MFTMVIAAMNCKSSVTQINKPCYQYKQAHLCQPIPITCHGLKCFQHNSVISVLKYFFFMLTSSKFCHYIHNISLSHIIIYSKTYNNLCSITKLLIFSYLQYPVLRAIQEDQPYTPLILFLCYMVWIMINYMLAIDNIHRLIFYKVFHGK